MLNVDLVPPPFYTGSDKSTFNTLLAKFCPLWDDSQGPFMTSVLDEIIEHVEEQWKPNVMHVNVDNEEYLRKHDAALDAGAVVHDLVDFLCPAVDEHRLHVNGTPSSLFDHISPFFDSAADALVAIGERLEIDFIHGELLAAADEMRSEVHKPETEPRCFNRIHMSNIP